ncbi:MAG TPA: hypothetical protein VGK58_20635 [Lacipirellulaceae bacterium]
MHHIIWRQSALNELAELWVDADAVLRETITMAVAEIDSSLARSPNDIGESRPDDRRIAFEPPLGYIFEVRSLDQQVVISHVWLTRN